MVRVLANGELVQDDDLRLRPPISQGLLHQPRPATSQTRIARDSFSTHQNRWMVCGVSYIHTINQWFNNRGLPTIQVGPYSIEPILSTGLLASLIFFGNRGFCVTGVLVLAAKYFQLLYRRRNPGSSQGNIARSADQHQQPLQQNSYVFSGPGHRLGRL